ncbi:uncharacterized protein METZ01_LOCUS170630 [marine metagenome]|uniref:Uncharacterized protein n=1 Tax=marine metagenome TaxID=408172 RepID=A0A382BVD1_9ZZZZ
MSLTLAIPKTYYNQLTKLALGHCLMVGRVILVHEVGVRLTVPQSHCFAYHLHTGFNFVQLVKVL